MKVLCLTLALLLIFSVSLTNVNALTKDEAAKQLAQRNEALNKIKNLPAVVNRTNPVNLLVLDLSNSCIKLIKYNMTQSCLTYNDLAILDETDQRYSGKFVYDNTGFLHREKPLINNHEIQYKNKLGIFVCVDCPGKVATKARSIIIEPAGFVYILKSEKAMIDNTRNVYHDRYVKDCQTARVSSNMTLIVDTINYMKSNCTVTEFNEKETIVKPYSKKTYDGAAYQYQKWLENAKKFKTINCLKSPEC